MLFKRLYNWIKYKTLPPSFLFKNRLFIERDSKHRRVMSNFGLSFRNSKWSNYETYNIKSNFRTNFLSNLYFFLYSLTMGLICYYGHGYYLEHYEFNRYAIPFWSTIDSIDYYLTFVIWLIASIGSIISNTLYSYFFFNNFSLSSKKKNTSSTSLLNTFTDNSSFENKDLYVSKHDLNWVLYSWLTNDNSKKNVKILENLFNSNLNSTFWNSNYDFFSKLYKMSYLINVSSNQSSGFNDLIISNNLISKNQKLNFLNFYIYFNNSNLLGNKSDVFFYYFLKNNINYFNVNKTRFPGFNYLQNRYEWNLYNFDKEASNYSFLVKNKVGLFFFDDFNYQKLSHLTSNFSELWFLNNSFKNQLNAGKWNRWLYRYSILHRKILKNSHKLTLAKRLINSGFYDSKIFNKNIWATEHLLRINSSETFSSFFNSYYNSIYNKEIKNYNNIQLNLNGNGSQIESLSLLNFYENSYFWYLKRFYLFNTLPNNFIKSRNQINNYPSFNFNNLNLIKDNAVAKHTLFLNYLLNSYSLNLANYSHSSNLFSDLQLLNFSSFNDINLEKNFYNLKDIYLNTNDNDLLNKDNLNLIYWITSNSSKNNNVLFFDYLNNNYYSKILLMDNKIFTNRNNNNIWLIYSLINADKFFLNDAIYLSLFY